jgi:HEAT repeat protein
MDFATTFARHLARLVWLIRTQPEAVDEQKGALRAIVTIAKDGEVVLRADESRLLANGTPLPDVLSGVKEVAAALSGAVAYALTFDKSAAPADILAIARLMATESPDPMVRRVAQLAPKTARMEAVGEQTEPARARATAQLTAELVAEIEADKARAAAADAVAAEPSTPSIPQGRMGNEFLDSLFDRLNAPPNQKALSATLEDIVVRVEVHSRLGDLALVTRAMVALFDRESAFPEGDPRRAYVVALRRLFRPQVLRVLMPLLHREPEHASALRRILERAGEEGPLVVFEEILRARTRAERAEFIDLIRSLPATVSTLQRLLNDGRWHVVRSAVELLGEIAAPETDRIVADMLKHPDDRVRRAVTAAIARFDTPFAVDALYRALSDQSAQVRLQAVDGLAARKTNARAAAVVAEAIDAEPEVEVQLAEIAALGRFATSEAVTKLTRAAEPDGRLFGKKNALYRVAAVRALAEARTPAAMAALQSLTSDRDKEVRDAVARGMQQQREERLSTAR